MTTDPLAGLSEPKRQIARTFDTLAGDYDVMRFTRRTSDRLIELAELSPGEQVLDVATGTGWAASAAAEAVGEEGYVLGTDISEAVLARARKKARAAELKSIEFRTGDAERLDLADQSMDVVLCASGLFFLPDPGAALSDWRRVLRPGGRVIFSAFEAGLMGKLRELYVANLERLGVSPAPGGAFWDAAHCRNLLEVAGFREVRTLNEQLGYHLPNADAWWDELWGGLYRRALEPMSPEQLASFRTGYLRDVAATAGEQGIWVNVPAVFALGVAP